MPQCRSCDAPIMWAKTVNDKLIPIDADSSAGWDTPELDRIEGNVFPTGESAMGKYGPLPIVEIVPPDGGKRWRPHWATCPDAKNWKKSKTTRRRDS